VIEYVDESGLSEDGYTIPPELPDELPPEPLPEQPHTDTDDRRAWVEALSRRVAEREAEAKEELTGKDGRSRKLDFRCSEEEVARWESAAQAEDVSVSEFLRLAADERAAQLVS
jgi:hypothetical protein